MFVKFAKTETQQMFVKATKSSYFLYYVLPTGATLNA